MSKKFKIKNIELQKIISGSVSEFPKYTSQIINLANQNAQGTRPKVVGQMSDLIQEFGGQTLAQWDKWYKAKQPNAIEDATNKIFAMVESLKEAIKEIDRSMVKKWVDDLVILKTFMGLRFQEAILKRIADQKGESYRLALPEEESKGIDGYIGYTPVSIKPTTYKYKKNLVEEIGERIIFYEKKKDGINVIYDF